MDGCKMQKQKETRLKTTLCVIVSCQRILRFSVNGVLAELSTFSLCKSVPAVYSSRSIHFNTVILFVSFLPSAHILFTLIFAPSYPSVVPTIAALQLHSGCGQAYRQLCPELIAKLFCRSPIKMHLSGIIGRFCPLEQAYHLCNRFSCQAQESNQVHSQAQGS